METLIAGLVLFIAVHFIPLKTQVRTGIIARIGEGPYKGLFSLVSLVGFYLIVSGKAKAPMIMVWTPPAWTVWITIVLMFFAVALIAGAYLPSNIKRITAHPMLWGVFTWSIAHLCSNGDAASIILFGGFGLFAIVSIIASTMKAKATENDTDSKMTLNWSKDIVVVTLGAVIFASILYFHMSIFGKPVLA